MANNRIYYAIQQVSIKPNLQQTVKPIHGLQSVGVTTNFNLSQAFELGQQSLYENIEEIPDVQISLKKVLDGYPPIYCLATADATTPTLAARSVTKAAVNLAIFDESSTSAAGNPVGIMEASGMYVSSVKYNFPKDGNFDEEVTLVGNQKVWRGDSRINAAQWFPYPSTGPTGIGMFDGTDQPLSIVGVARRQDLSFTYAAASGNSAVAGYGNYQLDPNATVLPKEVAGISFSGTNNLSDPERAHIDSISVSVNLNRENLTELGRKVPYFRVPTYPVEVTTEIAISATSGDMISATESGILSTSNTPCTADLGNVGNSTIRIHTCEGTYIYTGQKNKLASVNYTGGDAGGGAVTVSYTFNTFNDFTVMHSGESEGRGWCTPSGFATYLRN
jgi:hypothetical protein